MKDDEQNALNQQGYLKPLVKPIKVMDPRAYQKNIRNMLEATRMKETPGEKLPTLRRLVSVKIWG